MAISDSQVQPGDVIAGKYQVERVLGMGGMGVVVAAMHLQLRERVALKFLLPDALENPDIVERFEREARAAVRIKSEYVARMIDVGTLPNGAPYMVMEYLDGMDLAHALASEGAFSVRYAVDCALQACVAVAEAHSHGIVHRDLKPGNLFRVKRRDGHALVKVLDFGISKLGVLSGDPSGAVTKTASIIGSPSYMSPEQMRSAKSVDERTDIWALGVILYELTTRQKPFDGETYPEVCLKVVSEWPAPLSAYVRDLPPGFEAVVLRCLQKRREDRFANVGELARALAPFASREEQSLVERIAGSLGPSQPPAPSAGYAPAPAPAVTPSPNLSWRHDTIEAPAAPAAGTGGAWGQPSAASRTSAGKSKAPIVVLASAALVMAVAGGLFLARHRSSTGAPEIAPVSRSTSAEQPATVPAVPLPAPSPASAPVLSARDGAVAVEAAPAVSPSTGTLALPAPPATPPAVPGHGPKKAPAAAVPREAAPKEAVPKEAAPKEAAPKEAAPKEAAPKEAAPKEAAPRAPGADQCSPDYFYDANGKKVFKKECFK